MWVDEAGSEPEEVLFGFLTSDLKLYWNRGQGTAIAQFYNLVMPGIILANHIFEGLERPLYCDDNEHGDQNKRIYTWRPVHDFEYDSRRKKQIVISAPRGKVFAVIVTPNTRHADDYPNIKAWIDRWNWVDEDEELNDAPSNWVDRYNRKIWTRE